LVVQTEEKGPGLPDNCVRSPMGTRQKKGPLTVSIKGGGKEKRTFVGT